MALTMSVSTPYEGGHDVHRGARRGAAAIFLDKDGTLIEDVPYNVDPGAIALATGAREGLPLLTSLGYRLFVVSNQSGVARGLFRESDLEPVSERLRELALEAGAEIEGFYYCPHLESGTVSAYAARCACRKPEPGLVLRAAAEHRLDLERSWLVGDILNDVEAGRRAGCRTVLLDVGHETEWLDAPLRRPDLVAGDLAVAARLIASADRAAATGVPG